MDFPKLGNLVLNLKYNFIGSDKDKLLYLSSGLKGLKELEKLSVDLN